MVKTKPPAQLHAGTSVSWVINLPDHQPDQGWLVEYRLVSATDSIPIAAQALGGDFEVKIGASQSKAFPAGVYTLIGVAKNEATDQAVVINKSAFTVLPDAITSADHRTHEEKTLEAVRALLAGKSTEDQQMLQYNGRTLSRYTVADLLSFESRLARTVARQKARKAGQKGYIGARF